MANVKKEFGIPSFTGSSGYYDLNNYADELARGYLNYKNAMMNQLSRSGIYGGGAVGSFRSLEDWTRNQAGLLSSAKQYSDMQTKLQDLTTKYNEAQSNYLADKEEMQHRFPGFGILPTGRSESEAKMNRNKALMDSLKTEIDALTNQMGGYAGNPFVGQAALGMPWVKSGLETSYKNALGADFGDIQDTLTRIGGGLAASYLVPQLGSFLFKETQPMIAGTPMGPLQVGSTAAGPLAGLNPMVKPLVEAYQKFTGSDPMVDISQMLMEGTPVDKALEEIMTKGKNYQILNQLQNQLPLQKVTMGPSGITREYGPSTTGTSLKDMQPVNPEEFGKAYGKRQAMSMGTDFVSQLDEFQKTLPEGWVAKSGYVATAGGRKPYMYGVKMTPEEKQFSAQQKRDQQISAEVAQYAGNIINYPTQKEWIKYVNGLKGILSETKEKLLDKRVIRTPIGIQGKTSGKIPGTGGQGLAAKFSPSTILAVERMAQSQAAVELGYAWPNEVPPEEYDNFLDRVEEIKQEKYLSIMKDYNQLNPQSTSAPSTNTTTSPTVGGSKVTYKGYTIKGK